MGAEEIEPSRVERVTARGDYSEPDPCMLQGRSLLLMRAIEMAAGELGLPTDDLAALRQGHTRPFLPLPHAACLQALGRLRQSCPDPALGIRLGAAINEANLHSFGALLLVSTSARVVAEAFVRFGEVFTGGNLWQVWQDDGRVYVGRCALAEAEPGASLEAELVISFLYALADRFWGPWARAELRATFTCQPPTDATHHLQFFGADVQFAAALDTYSFPEEWLDRERPGADANLAQAMYELVRTQMTQAAQSWSDRVRAALSAAPQPAQLDGESLAQRWGISVRSLRRKLEAEQTSLSTLHDAVLYERARVLLARPTLRMHEVADALGYYEVSSFQRAFKRWAGVAPGAYRRRES
jgi:AraC-like DNA-binding protein